MLMTLLYIGVALVVGFILGALVMRNNYKHYMNDEAKMRAMILNSSLSAEQKLLHIRNKLGV